MRKNVCLISAAILSLFVPLAFSSSLPSLEEYFPKNHPVLSPAVDEELVVLEEFTPGVIHHHVSVWTLEGPLSIHLVFIDLKREELSIDTFRTAAAPSGGESKLPVSFENSVAGVAGGVPDVASLLQGIKDGRTSFMTLDLSPPDPLLKLRDHLGGGLLLLKEGKKQTIPDDVKKRAPSSLTALGILKKKNQVLLAAVDGDQPGMSIGMTPERLTAYLSFLGCRDALALDLGGSFLLFGRRAGEIQPQKLNSPSKQRSLPLRGLFIKGAPPSGKPDRLATRPDSITALAGASYPLSIRVVDRFGHRVEPKDEMRVGIKPETIGSMDGTVFTAGCEEEEGKIVIRLSGEKAVIPVRVIPCLSRLEIDRDFLSLFPGEEALLTATGYGPDGKPAGLASGLVEWSASSNLGDFVSPGRFRAAPSNAGSFSEQGTIYAKVGEMEASIPVAVGRSFTKISDFSSLSGWRFHANPPRIQGSFDIIMNHIDGERTPVGWLRFDFTGRKKGATVYAVKSMPIPGRPRKIGLWVRGDGQGHQLWGVYRDSLGRDHTIRLAPEVDWTDWKRLELDLPGDLSYPITWKQLYLVRNDSVEAGKGNCQFARFVALSPPPPPPPDSDRYRFPAFPGWLSWNPEPHFASKSNLRFFAFGNSREAKEDRASQLGAKFNSFVVGYLNRRGGDFLLCTGNLSGNARAENLEIVKKKIQALEFPCYPALGKSDTIGDPEVLNHPMMIAPTHYEKTHDDATVFVLDNTRGGFLSSDRHQKPAGAQWPWLLERLEENRSELLVFACHLTPFPEEIPGLEGMNLFESRIFHRLLCREVKKGKRVMVISGGSSCFDVRVKDGIPYFTTGGGGAPLERPFATGGFHHYLEFSVQKDRIEFSIRPLVTRIGVKWKPVKTTVGRGENLSFEATGIVINPGAGTREIVTMTRPLSFAWRTKPGGKASIDPRGGQFEALEPGMVEVLLDTGDIYGLEKIRIVGPGE